MSARTGHRIRTVLLFGFVAVLALVLLPLNTEYQQGLVSADAAEDAPVLVDVALVNEDAGALFQGEDVNLGRAYVTQLENDTSAEWHVVSRAVAENGLAFDTYQLMLIIPTDFSAKLADINAADPAPIGVTYQANGGGNPRVEANAQALGQRVVHQLNRQLVDMYLASIVGNLHQAQENVRAMTTVEATSRDRHAQGMLPAVEQLAVDLGTAGRNTDGAHTGAGALVDSLDGLASASTSQQDGHHQHTESLAELVAAREDGAVTEGEFIAAIISLRSDLLSDQVAAMYDELVAASEAIADQLAADRAQATLAGRLVQVRDQADTLAQQIGDRQQQLAAATEQSVLDGHRSQVVATVDQDGDGIIRFRDLLAHLGNSTAAPAVTDSLLTAAEQQVSRLPYRDRASFDAAVADGIWDGAGQRSDLIEQVGAALDRLLAWDGFTAVRVDSDRVIGAELPLLRDGLTVAREAVATMTPDPEPEPVPDDSAEPAPAPEPSEVTALTEAAAEYGATLAEVAAAYRDAELAVALLQVSTTSWDDVLDIDLSAAFDQVIVDAVSRQIVDEQGSLQITADHLASVRQTLTDLDGSMTSLTDTSATLATNVVAQLGALDAYRRQLADIADQGATVQKADAQSDQGLAALAQRAAALLSASQSLVSSSAATRDQAERLAQDVADVGAQVQNLSTGATDLSGQTQDFTDLLTQEVADSQLFSDTFSGVLANSHTSDVLNERLMTFLSAPVTASAREPVASSDVTRPFPWVLIVFALSFVAASALLATVARHRNRAVFARGRAAWLGPNVRALGVSALVAVLLGTVLAWLSARSLGVPREAQLSWGLCVVLAVVECLLAVHWLLAQWRTVGVGLSVLLLVGYVFVSDAVGFGATAGVSAAIAAVDPLCHVERAMTRLLGEGAAALPVVGTLFAWSAGFAVLNLLLQPDLRRLLPTRLRPVTA